MARRDGAKKRFAPTRNRRRRIGTKIKESNKAKRKNAKGVTG